METKTISYWGKPVAHVFFNKISAKGVRFLTPAKYTLQLGLIEHKTGTVVRDHIHRQDIKYNVDTTQEFLYIEKGKVKVKLFGPNWQELETVLLGSGDFILFVSGGHGLEVEEDCRILEIKQGPYPGDDSAKIYRESKRIK